MKTADRARSWFPIVVLTLLLPCSSAWGERLAYAFDTDQRLVFGCCGDQDVPDHHVIVHEPGSPDVSFHLLGLAERVAIDAVAVEGNGVVHVSLDTAVDLGGLVVLPSDVVRFGAGTPTLTFDGAAAGLPGNADVDAFARHDDPALPFLVSFTTAVSLPDSGGGSFLADDEDVVATDGLVFSMFFDGSSTGLDGRLDLDALHYDAEADALLLSVGGAGEVAGVVFDDEDVLTFERGSGTWSLRHDFGSAHADLASGADLAALSRIVDLFADGFEGGDTSQWTFEVP